MTEHPRTCVFPVT